MLGLTSLKSQFIFALADTKIDLLRKRELLSIGDGPKEKKDRLLSVKESSALEGFTFKFRGGVVMLLSSE